MLFEPKWDGFRALAYIEQGQRGLVSRKGHVYKAWMRHRYQVDDGQSHVVVEGQNPDYSQWEPRPELFEARRDNAQHRDRWVKRRWPWCNASHAVPPFL